MIARQVRPTLRVALVLSAVCGCAAPTPDAPTTPALAHASPPAPADAAACPPADELAHLIRSAYAVPTAPLGGITCLAVRQVGPHWFIDGWRELPPGDPDAGSPARVAVLVDALSRRVVWRDPYGGVGGVAPPPRRTAVDLDRDGRDELVVASGYPQGIKTLAVHRWDADEGWIDAGRAQACGLAWPDWRLVPGGPDPIVEVRCASATSRYHWTGEELVGR